MKPEELRRLEKYFDELCYLIPTPPRGWEEDMKPCKWLKIIQEQKQKNPDATG
jgi:hypothetical protein